MSLGEYLQMSDGEKEEMSEKEYQSIIDEGAPSVADGLLQALQNEELMNHTASIMRKITDGEPVNSDPLTEIPESEMRLYGIFETYFETQEELESYCQGKGYSLDKTCILDYLRSVAGRSDVIRKTSKDGRSMLYTAVDEDGYGIYNHERSFYRGEFVWEYSRGKISEMYSAFRDRGIVFEDDVYGKIDERNKQLLRMCKVRKISNKSPKNSSSSN